MTPERKPPFFTDLRTSGWRPRFHWNLSLRSTADEINQPHEDYPNRVVATRHALDETMAGIKDGRNIDLTLARSIHRTIFPDHAWGAGEWRHVNVTVGEDRPPRWELVERLMEQLDLAYRYLSVDIPTLRAWYLDFNTIHPLRDGNGRTSGVIVAAYSHRLTGAWLAPEQ